MGSKAIPLETRICRGCGGDFQTTDDRKRFHNRRCHGLTRTNSNAWLVVNRPDLPTEPCLTCQSPVVQYRARRSDGELRYCKRRCQPNPKANYHGPTKQVLIASKAWSGKCRWCGKANLAYGNTGCTKCFVARRLVLLRLRNKLRLLLPKTCVRCGLIFNRIDHGWTCTPCQRSAARHGRQLRRLRKKGDGSYDSGIDYVTLFNAANGVCAICQGKCDEPSVWSGWDGLTWMPNAPTVDHIVALANGGAHTWENVQLACSLCNSQKGDRPTPGASLF